MGKPALRLIDTETGEISEGTCPHCEEREAATVQLERDLRKAKAAVTRMQRDQEAEARDHKLWDEAQALHDWWAIACDHPGVKFDAEAFRQVLPRLKEVGPIGVLQAVAGVAFDPNSAPRKNGTTELFNDWELLNRSGAKAKRFRERAPGRPDGEEWKRWLVDRIEARLKED